MGFLAPIMLWGAAAAAIPIALHFFFRSRYRVVPWAAMKFLLDSIEQTSRRLRFQELLLLILRCALLVLLALALARPLSSAVRGGGRGDAVDAVLVFDTSYSMGASDGAQSRLARAQQAALQIIDQLPAHSTVQVLACADRANLLGPRSPSDLEQARVLIGELAVSSLATDLYPGVVEAAGVLQRGQAPNKELYVFSDMQKLGFERQAGGLSRALQDIKEKAAVFFIRCGTRPSPNVAIIGITPQSGVPRPGERIGFAVLVRNTGAEPVKDLQVSLAVDGNDKLAEAQALPRIDPGETRAVALTAKLEKAGPRVLTARVVHDDLEGDNRYDQVVLVREQVHVLVIDGGARDRDPEKWSSFNLMNALSPVKDSERSKHYLQPRLVTPRLASPALLARADLCILVNVALEADPKKPAEVLPADFAPALATFVKQGKGLIIYAGDNVAPEVYNRVLGGQGLLPLPVKSVLDQPKAPLKLDPGSAGLPAFWKFRDDDYYKGFKDIAVYRALELQEPDKNKNDPAVKDPLNVVFRYSSGKAAVVSRLCGDGEVLLVSTAADKGWARGSTEPTWTDWPLHFEFVPFVDGLVSHLLQGQTQTSNLIAGSKLEWYLTSSGPGDSAWGEFAYTLVCPDGKHVRLGLPEKRNTRSVISAADLPLAGVYKLVARRQTQSDRDEESSADSSNRGAAAPQDVPIAVVPDLRESQDLTLLTDREIDERLGFQPIHLTASGTGSLDGADERLNREWTTTLLALVLALAFGESVLAYWCGRAW
jgi:hypothetical protein